MSEPMWPSPESQKSSDKEIPIEKSERSSLEGLSFPESIETNGSFEQERIEEIKEGLKTIPDHQSETFVKGEKEEKSFLKYVPDYLRDKRDSGVVATKILEFLLSGRVEKRNLDKLPAKGPFLTISNHFTSDPLSAALLSSLAKYDTHLAVSSDVHWQNPLKRWFFRYLRTLEVPGTLSHLSDQEKESLLGRIPQRSIRRAYQKMIENDAKGESKEMIQFVRTAAALLARGDVVALYPEGHWLYDGENGSPRKEELYQGYRGIETISKQFEKYTGKPLLIVPIAVYREGKKRIVDVGESIQLQDNQSALSGTDWAMKRLANLLPEGQRGFYRD